ncbi:putative UPF0481 protein [Glycine soja]
MRLIYKIKVIQIRETLNEVIEDDQFPDPDSYTPQQVAIGPYHYWRQELYEMERYKIASAKTFQEKLQNRKLEHMVDQLIRLEHRIRACYHRYLYFNGGTLMWMMVIDASFLLEFLQVYSIQDGAMIPRVSSRMSHLMDYAGRKIAHNEILKDIVIEKDYPEIIVLECTHLLDFLYAMIAPKLEEQSDLVQLEDQHRDKEDNEKSIVNYAKQFLSEDKEATKADDGNLSSDNVINKPPLMEEISGLCFIATNGDISTIGFDVKTVTLNLPTIGLDLNSEVLLRNLVAYEASTALGSLVFTRYTELMNGIIIGFHPLH